MKKIIFSLILCYVNLLALSFSYNNVLLLGSNTKFNYFLTVENKSKAYITYDQWKTDNLIDVKFLFFTIHKSHFSTMVKYNKGKNITEEIRIDHNSKDYIKKVYSDNKSLDLWYKYNNNPAKDDSKQEKKENNKQKNNNQSNQQISINYKTSFVDIESKKFPAIELEALFSINNQQFKAIAIFISSNDLKNFLKERNVSSKDISYFEKYINKYKLDISTDHIPVQNLSDNLDKGIKELLKPILTQGKDILHSINLLKDNRVLIQVAFLNEIKILPYNPQDFEIPSGYTEKK